MIPIESRVKPTHIEHVIDYISSIVLYYTNNRCDTRKEILIKRKSDIIIKKKRKEKNSIFGMCNCWGILLVVQEVFFA